MPHILIWNKRKTKVKVYTTISEGDLTEFMEPEKLVEDDQHRDLVLRDVYNVCPCCGSNYWAEV